MNLTSNECEGGLLKAAEIARILSVDAKTVHNWSEAGKIPVAYRLGGTVRFNLEDVKRVIAAETEKAQQLKLQRMQAARRRNTSPATRN